MKEDSRPLREVPTRALYALHRGIERQLGLISEGFRSKDGYPCALGSQGDITILDDVDFKVNLIDNLVSIGLLSRFSPVDGVWVNGGISILELNDGFEGTPEERREFMLRHIVTELRFRGESISGDGFPLPAIRRERVCP